MVASTKEPCLATPACLCPECIPRNPGLSRQSLTSLRQTWEAVEAAPEPPESDECEEFLVMLARFDERLSAERKRFSPAQVRAGYAVAVDLDRLAVALAKKLWAMRSRDLERMYQDRRRDSLMEVATILDDTLAGNSISACFRADDPLALLQI